MRYLAQATIIVNVLLLLTVAVLVMGFPVKDESGLWLIVAGYMLVVLAPTVSIVMAALWLLRRARRGSGRQSRSR